jgi:hypothetical protein
MSSTVCILNYRFLAIIKGVWIKPKTVVAAIISKAWAAAWRGRRGGRGCGGVPCREKAYSLVVWMYIPP